MGLFIILVGFLLWIGIGYPIEIIGLIGFINIILGIITPKSPGLAFLQDPTAKVKLIVDKARSRSGTFQLVFMDTKLIMKKLAGQGAMVATVFIFAILGGMVGGATGWSLQEYLVERKRKKVQQEQGLMSISKGDVEIPYASMNQVELAGSKLKINSPNGPVVIFLGKKYPPLIMAKLRELIPNGSWIGPVPMQM